MTKPTKIQPPQNSVASTAVLIPALIVVFLMGWATGIWTVFQFLAG